ncbi:MAG TPA: translocation/assembly module TamB domain-containing protein [Acidocella sp.]|uniref:translocation/assembly module TamB domain-containing protein n=1 Tax=Acidocella sp. TaxID=50710 RepID=UPI002C119EE8|nr:translocation/assembly module TamB domain-containing protein [Acidocella sp.]HVE21221.1 translocation/assembly module TamB domain-containing protein [Acidocella sp.]
MLRTLKILLRLCGFLILLAVLAMGGLVIGLNTGAGRHFAVTQINRLLGPQIEISGLGGHFPADLKLASLRMADAQGTWLTGEELELRWQPAALLHHDLHVTSLTAARLEIPRLPQQAASGPPSGSGGSGTFPPVSLRLDRLAVPQLALGPAIAGQAVTLDVTGAARLPRLQNFDLQNLRRGSATLNATTPQGADYRVLATLDGQQVQMKLHVAEPSGGLIGQLAAPQLHTPLALDLAMAGPRDHAALNFALALGAARLNGHGTVGLIPNAPSADLVLDIPALAPFGAFAAQQIAGNAALHLHAAQQPNGGTILALDGAVALSQAPFDAAKYVGPAGRFSLRANLQDQSLGIEQFDASGAAFRLSASGSIAPSSFNLETHVSLPQVSDFAPGISGQLAEDGSIVGAPRDFAVNALLTGDLVEKNVPSGPFSIGINAQHLPYLPSGTLTGSGALLNAPLLLAATFARAADGTMTLVINNALWRSLDATANLTLAPGAYLPTGTANFKLGNLADFQSFSPVRLRGSVNGDFSHLQGQIFKLDLDAKNLLVTPQLGAVDTTIHALGPTKALNVKARANIANLASAPASLALAGVLDLDDRSANVTALSASWRDINTRLLGPTSIATQSGIVVRHLALGLNGGRIALDGRLTPQLAATVDVQNLPADTARYFAPGIKATGLLSATATLTGPRDAPSGKLTLAARSLKLHEGEAAALPPADINASANFTSQNATIDAHMTAGPMIGLTASGLVPLSRTGAINLRLNGRTDLRVLDPFLATRGNVVRGEVAVDMMVTGTPAAPQARGTATLANGAVTNISSGLNLTRISARIGANGRLITLDSLNATAGEGRISGSGRVDLGNPNMPLDVTVIATDATPISSDIIDETLDANLHLAGALRGKMALGGTVRITKANINIPRSLPPNVANLPIIYPGQAPPPPPTPPPPVALDLTISATNRIFVRGDGLFAELGGHLHIGGTADRPDPEGGFELIRGNLSLAGKTLQFSKGQIGFNGAGFMPTLDLEATTVTTTNNTASLIIGGTAAQPKITLTSTPPLPSDEILAQLLFGESTSGLSAFQAASLAAALAQLSGVGSGLNPLARVRSALGLDELSFGGSGSGPPSVQAGRYVAPGVYVGASQATNGQGTQASVQINLYKGLKLNSSTGTSSTGTGDASSIGLTYQFNY